MKPIVIILLILVGLTSGCGPMYGGGSFASYGNPDHETTTEVVTQCDPQGHLLFVIAWTAKHGGGTTTDSDRNLFTRIHGHPIHPNLDHRDVYALQADGGLKRISLTDGQITELFREMRSTNFHTSHCKLWQEAIAPHLIRVEANNGS